MCVCVSLLSCSIQAINYTCIVLSLYTFFFFFFYPSFNLHFLPVNFFFFFFLSSLSSNFFYSVHIHSLLLLLIMILSSYAYPVFHVVLFIHCLYYFLLSYLLMFTQLFLQLMYIPCLYHVLWLYLMFT